VGWFKVSALSSNFSLVKKKKRFGKNNIGKLSTKSLGKRARNRWLMPIIHLFWRQRSGGLQLKASLANSS
jgi:hypothetical protein